MSIAMDTASKYTIEQGREAARMLNETFSDTGWTFSVKNSASEFLGITARHSSGNPMPQEMMERINDTLRDAGVNSMVVSVELEHDHCVRASAGQNRIAGRY